jgi:hypothetical protein
MKANTRKHTYMPKESTPETRGSLEACLSMRVPSCVLYFRKNQLLYGFCMGACPISLMNINRIFHRYLVVTMRPSEWLKG